MSDFTDAFEEHFVPYTRWQFQPGAKVGYRWVPGASSSSTIYAMPPQPAGENELRKLPDGEQVDSAEIIYSPVELNTRVDERDADIIERGGKYYEVRAVDTRDDLGGHFKCLVVLNNDPPEEIMP